MTVNDFPLEKAPVFIRHSVPSMAFLEQLQDCSVCGASWEIVQTHQPTYLVGRASRGMKGTLSEAPRNTWVWETELKTVNRSEWNWSLAWLDFCTLGRILQCLGWTFSSHKVYQPGMSPGNKRELIPYQPVPHWEKEGLVREIQSLRKSLIRSLDRSGLPGYIDPPNAIVMISSPNHIHTQFC